jgi:hypothetical protein
MDNPHARKLAREQITSFRASIIASTLDDDQFMIEEMCGHEIIYVPDLSVKQFNFVVNRNDNRQGEGGAMRHFGLRQKTKKERVNPLQRAIVLRLLVGNTLRVLPSRV